MQSNRNGSVQEDRVRQRMLVLGIGDLLWADEGFGVRAVEFLAARPSDRQACRKGDDRVLESKDFHRACRPASFDGLSVGVDQHPEKYRGPKS